MCRVVEKGHGSRVMKPSSEVVYGLSPDKFRCDCNLQSSGTSDHNYGGWVGVLLGEWINV